MAPINRPNWEAVVAQAGCFVVAKLQGGKLADVHAAHRVEDLPDEPCRAIAELAFRRGMRKGRQR